MNRVQLSLAFVLHTRSYRDTSLLADLLTAEHGRIRAVARSARGPRSRFKGLIQPFTPLLISWVGKGELVSLTHAEISGAPFLLSGKNLLSSFYLNELLVRLLHAEDSCPAIFQAYQDALIGFAENIHPEWVLRIFEKQLLTSLGYGLQLDKEADTGCAISEEQLYYYENNRGFVKNDAVISDNTPVFLGKVLLALHHQILEEIEDLREMKRLMRLVLANLLGNKPLYSRELFS
jgi:DNA repair protein RecO (recombination protein O)